MLVRALYAYSATSNNDISIHADERLALIEGGVNSQTGSCWGDSGDLTLTLTRVTYPNPNPNPPNPNPNPNPNPKP